MFAAFTHVAETFCVRKSVSKHKPVRGVDLDLPDRFPARPLEAEVKPSDSGEERSDSLFFFMLNIVSVTADYYLCKWLLIASYRACKRSIRGCPKPHLSALSAKRHCRADRAR
jgi:hypothetical protein